MTSGTIPYLCGGTFLCQVLRARKQLKTATDHTNSNKESLSEQETFRRLISIYQLSDFYGGSSLKPYTSKFKSCKDSLTAYAQLNDSDLRLAFDSAVKTEDAIVMQMMSDFVKQFIDVKGKGEQLVRCLLGMIDKDGSILPDEEFFIDGSKAVTKSEIIRMDSFRLEPFLLGVWHYIIMNRADKNECGADTYNAWYAGRGKYIGTVGNDIAYNITVKSAPAIPIISAAGKKGIIQQSSTLEASGDQYSEADTQLLKEFTSDYDELVMKCIGANFPELIIDGRLCREIASLYSDKWSDKANGFENLSLKPNIWAMFNCLNELCKAINSDTPYDCGPSLRQIQTKLRNLYVKLHPSDYANVFSYDAIYDDWSFGEDY